LLRLAVGHMGGSFSLESGLNGYPLKGKSFYCSVM